MAAGQTVLLLSGFLISPCGIDAQIGATNRIMGFVAFLAIAFLVETGARAPDAALATRPSTPTRVANRSTGRGRRLPARSGFSGVRLVSCHNVPGRPVREIGSALRDRCMRHWCTASCALSDMPAVSPKSCAAGHLSRRL